jgi:hypothetical protein
MKNNAFKSLKKIMLRAGVISFLSASLLISIPSAARADGCAYVCDTTGNSADLVCSQLGETVGTTISLNGVADCPNAPSCGLNTQAICCCQPTGSAITPAGATPTEAFPKFTMPQLQINIPTVDLTEPSCASNADGSYSCQIRWIGQYILGIYNYGLAIAGILAAIVLMAGGVLWLVSGGDASKVTQAKELIGGSVVGLVILASSYIILTQVNPDLGKFKAITVGTIKKAYLTDHEAVSGNPYAAECAAAKNGDLSLCAALGVNGNKPVLTALEDTEADPQVATAYKKALQCVADNNDGKTLFKINEGWRSPQTQIAYFNKYGVGKAATPCCSNHGSGQALDINRTDGQSMSWAYNTSSGLTACMNTNGLYANLDTEPWHWSKTGN